MLPYRDAGVASTSCDGGVAATHAQSSTPAVRQASALSKFTIALPQLLALILAGNVAAGKPVRFVSHAVHLVQDGRRLSEQL
jgi:hypothetical protein